MISRDIFWFLITSKNRQKISWNRSGGKLKIKFRIGFDPIVRGPGAIWAAVQCRQYVLCNWSINERSSTSDNDIHLPQARKVSQNILQTTSWAERKMTFRKKALKCIFLYVMRLKWHFNSRNHNRVKSFIESYVNV